jgi:hypothetical protein
MVYKKGTVSFKSGTRFKDNGQIDPRKGHPVLIPIASDDLNMNTYYLMIDSHPEKYIRFGDAYYIIEDWEEVNLREPSVVNLKNIYKGHINDRALGGFPPYLYRDVKKAFMDYQEEHPDEYYDEIKSKL